MNKVKILAAVILLAVFCACSEKDMDRYEKLIEAIEKMKGIPNHYYDMAAICDPSTMCQLIRVAGCDQVMWGTDYFIDRAHGCR